VVTLKIHNSGLDRLGATHFLTLRHPCVFRPILCEQLGQINEPTVVLSCSDKYFLILVQSRGDNNQLQLRFRKHTFCVD